MAEVMLTTIDNPYNPFNDFNAWYAFDCAKGYQTCEIVDKFLVDSDELPETYRNEDYEEAFDRIIELDPDMKFKKVYET